MEYLKLPVRFASLFQQKKLESCNMKESISRNIHLLITSQLGENKQDYNYGCQLWDHDYDIHMSDDSRREIVISSLKKLLANYEKRLGSVAIDVKVKQMEARVKSGFQLRRRIELIITGNIKRVNEPFRFQTAFFIGPMSFD
ncbi:MAG: GPW/gp25 family protein [Ferruginibacter sp.]